jgi:hypothetical protein
VLRHPGSFFGFLALPAFFGTTMALGELCLVTGLVGPFQGMAALGALAAEAEGAISLCHYPRVVCPVAPD